MNTFRNYADYEIPLLQVLADFPGGQGTSREVKDRFGERFDERIPDEHRVYLENVREAKWRNMMAWMRNTLINRGLMDSPAYGIWRITDAGRAHVAQAEDSVPVWLDYEDLLKDMMAREAADAISEDQQEELSKLAFIEQVRAVLDGLLISAGLPATLKAPWDQLIQVHFVAFSGCHYEVWVHARTIEVGLHFQTSRKLNYARLEWFHPHREALSTALGEEVRAEKWGENAARVFYELPRPPLSATVAAEFAGRLMTLIQGTLSILREAFPSRAERPRIEAHIETPTRAHIIIDTQIVTVRDFLNGRAGRPSDERLCDWVHLCYEFELYREGRELFALVDPTQVNPWYYERAKRLAKVCAMKVAGHA